MKSLFLIDDCCFNINSFCYYYFSSHFFCCAINADSWWWAMCRPSCGGPVYDQHIRLTAHKKLHIYWNILLTATGLQFASKNTIDNKNQIFGEILFVFDFVSIDLVFCFDFEFDCAVSLCSILCFNLVLDFYVSI